MNHDDAIAMAAKLLQTSAAWLCGQTNQIICSNNLKTSARIIAGQPTTHHENEKTLHVRNSGRRRFGAGLFCASNPGAEYDNLFQCAGQRLASLGLGE